MALALVYSSFSAQTSFPWIVSFACVSVIAACHWLAGLIAARPEREQQRWASIGGGAGVAYVFLHLMPALSSGGSELSDAPGMLTFVPTPMVEALLFLIALVGFACFFSIDVFASQSKKNGSWVAMLHALAFASINYLYAYTLPSLITSVNNRPYIRPVVHACDISTCVVGGSHDGLSSSLGLSASISLAGNFGSCAWFHPCRLVASSLRPHSCYGNGFPWRRVVDLGFS